MAHTTTIYPCTLSQPRAVGMTIPGTARRKVTKINMALAIDAVEGMGGLAFEEFIGEGKGRTSYRAL